MTLKRDLQTRALAALDWPLVCSALVARARSPLGQDLASRHIPFTTLNESRRLRQRVLEGLALLAHSPVHGYLSGTQNPSEFFERASLEGVLQPAELWACGHFMSTVGLVGEELRARSAQTPEWAADFAKAPETPPVCAHITRSVSSEGAILDSASAELARLRRERSQKRLDFENTLTLKIKDWHGKGLLQDNFYDVVDGRYVVPVKVELQSKLEGSLVSRSNTGQSVFVEPAELTSPNNALKELELAIRAEEFRILRALSAELGRLSPAFAPWIDALAELDLALAAAQLAKDWELNAPIVAGNSSELKLLEAFHPGLKLRNVEIVKNSLTISEGGHALLISGPNTGGKTVLLKAAALASCMARAGLLVPAAEGSVLPHYSGVLAFIGDEQNLAQGLSSFSAQILDMQAVLEEPSAPLLIVVDEILSSTDPEEASALAQSLIEEFVRVGHHVIVTSHFSDLSLRSKLNSRIAVAAMEFDGGKPTYRLRPDELGSSHALEVAQRLGFPERLLKRARELLSTAKLDYERAQAELKRKEQQLEDEHRRSIAEAHDEKERYKHELTSRLAAFMQKAQATLDETTRSITEKLSVASKTAARLATVIKDAETSIAKEAVDVETSLGKSAPVAPLPVLVGAEVKIRSMKRVRGVVLSLRGAGAMASATIQVGNFRLDKPLDELEVIPPKKEAALARYNYVGIDNEGPVPLKLDLRGKRYDEALAEAERYLDQAFRGGASSVTVITGHGTGALKKGLKELLGTLPYVRAFRPERANDDGATLVEFDR